MLCLLRAVPKGEQVRTRRLDALLLIRLAGLLLWVIQRAVDARMPKPRRWQWPATRRAVDVPMSRWSPVRMRERLARALMR